MAQVDWLHTGTHSEKDIVTAPSAGDVDDAVARVDAALDGYTGKVPGWFTAIKKLGYWWYAVCIAVLLVLALVLVPAGIGFRLTIGIVGGVVAAPLSGWALLLLAKLQSRSTGAASTEQALADVADRARPVTGETRYQVETVLDRTPDLEKKVHQLAWRSSQDAEARKSLEGLWEKAAPEEAAARAARIAEVEAGIADLKAQGKI